LQSIVDALRVLAASKVPNTIAIRPSDQKAFKVIAGTLSFI